VLGHRTLWLELGLCSKGKGGGGKGGKGEWPGRMFMIIQKSAVKTGKIVNASVCLP